MMTSKDPTRGSKASTRRCGTSLVAAVTAAAAVVATLVALGGAAAPAAASLGPTDNPGSPWPSSLGQAGDDECQFRVYRRRHAQRAGDLHGTELDRVQRRDGRALWRLALPDPLRQLQHCLEGR